MTYSLTRRDLLAAAGATAVGLSGCLGDLRGSAAADRWPMCGFDAANTSYSPAASGPGSGAEVLWRAEFEAFASPAIADGRMYVGSSDRGMYALSAEDGTTEWHVSTRDVVTSDPAVVDDTVYVAVSGDVLYALSADDGSEKWRREFWVASSSPTVHDGVVYIGSWEGYVYAFDAASGDRVWRASAPAGREVDNPPAVAGGRVFVDGKALYALDTDDGTAVWQFTDAGKVTAGPTVADGTVVAGFEDHSVRAFDAATGREQWAFQADDVVRSSPAVAEGRVVFGTNANAVHALDRATGDVVWTYDTEWLVLSAPAVASGTVYVGDRGSTLHAIDLAEGAARWRLAVGDGPGDALDEPVTVAGGRVYVASVHPMAVGRR